MHNSLHKNGLTQMAHTFAPSNEKDYPIAYAEHIWDCITNADSELAKMLGNVGQYGQHEINEAIAKAIDALDIRDDDGEKIDKQTIIDLINNYLTNYRGVLYISDPETDKDALKTIGSPELGDLYEVYNETNNTINRWIWRKKDGKAQWVLISSGNGRGSLSVSAVPIEGKANMYTIVFTK
ncbi:MAG: hypothetical protein E7069_12075 [Bacteroidales bacterium]|nr:hypothetical protein [Bacteroidales bacterium]